MAETRAAGDVAYGVSKQHRDLYRKVSLRKMLLPYVGAGSIYVPFVGDGDLAVELYHGIRPIYAADIVPERVATASRRLTNSTTIKVADCHQWPFEGVTVPFAVGDFDAFDYPYHSWRAFAEHAVLADTIAVFFTDDQRQPMTRHGIWTDPDGTKRVEQVPTDRPSARGGGRPNTPVTRAVYNLWWPQTIEPWWHAECERIGFASLRTFQYTARTVLYWGAIAERLHR